MIFKDLKGSYIENGVWISNDAENLQMRNSGKTWKVNLPTLTLHLQKWITRGHETSLPDGFQILTVFYWK